MIFHRAIKKYGEDSFEFSVIHEFDIYQDALDKEVELISILKPKYNITDGGQGVLGLRMSKETIEKIAAQRRGSIGYWRGKKRPPETVEKFRAAKLANPTRYWLGKTRDASTIEKIRMSKKGVPRNGGTALMLATCAENMRRAARARRKLVRCLDDGLEFESAAAASLYYGCHKTSVAGAINKKLKLYGRSFEYLQASL